VTGAQVTLQGASLARAGHHGPTPIVTPIVSRGVEHGRIETAHARPPGPETRNELELLARQAALAHDSRRLLGLEREQAAVRLELERVRDELLGIRTGAGDVLRAQDDERRRVADELQEDLAQALAAVLIGLRMLERGDEQGRAVATADVRAQVTSVLVQIRDLASTLRPSTMQQLGLAQALEALAEARAGHLRIEGAGDLPAMDVSLQEDAYRLIEELIRAGDTDAEVDIELRADDAALLVTATGAWQPPAMGIARARAAARGGTLELTGRGHIVHGILPLS
jgi:signal transduction histidine kinase